MTGLRVITGFLLLLTSAAMSWAEPPAGKQVFELTYGPRRGQELFSPGGRCLLGVTKPDSLKSEPEHKGKPLYGSLSLNAKAKPFLVVLDQTGKAGSVEGSLYIDRDRDGDLAEEKALALTVRGGV